MTVAVEQETQALDMGGIEPAVYHRRWAILGVLVLSLVLVVAAVSSVNVAIPSIRAQLLPTDAQMLWIVDIYAVVFAGLLLPAGALGDKFGRRGALQLGLIVFAAASVLSAMSKSPTALLGFRALMGVGAAFIMPSTLSLLTSVFPPHERARAIAVWTGFAGAGGVIGSLVGGLSLNYFWWGSVFFVSVPIAIVALVLVTTLCPSSKEAHAQPLDPLGAILSMVGFGSLLYGIIEGPEKGWGTVYPVSAFILSVAALTGFVLWERRAVHPMLDVRFFSIPRFGAGALGVTFTFMVTFGMFFLMAQYLHSVRGYSPLISGVATLPFALTMVAISPRGPKLGARFGSRRVVSTGFALMPIALVATSFIGHRSPYAYIVMCLVLLALGPALCIPTLSGGIVLSLPLDKAGVGSAVNDTTREVGGAVGIAVVGSILSSHYRSGMAGPLASLPPGSGAVVSVARRGVGALGGLVHASPPNPQLSSLLNTAKDEFVGGMQLGFRVGAVVMVAVGLLVARWYPSAELRPQERAGH